MTTHHLPISIPDILHGKTVEWERLEFKAGWNPEAVLHTICAFANDFHNLGGGYIVVGVAEANGRPVLPPMGLDANTVDAIQKQLLNLGNSAMQPAYHPRTVPYEIEGNIILVIWVPGGETRPYKTKVRLSDKKAVDWGYYIRKQSSTVRAKGANEQELIGLTATVPFDDCFNQQASVDDLSPRLIEDYLKEVGSDLAEVVASEPLEAIARQMNVVNGPSEMPFPKNVGLLFFNEAPERFFPATQIDVVWFPDGAGGDQFEEKEFKGPLGRMAREALDYIRRNYLKETVVKHNDRAEAERFWNFPYATIEEALVNAVYHRSYEIREPVEVRIMREELVILSFPGPDRSIKMADLQAGKAVSRRYRNRRVGEFLKELELTEGRSTGIPKMLRAMAENGSPAPELETDEDRSYNLVRLPVHADADWQELAAPVEAPVEAPAEAPVSVNISKILRYLNDQGAAGVSDLLHHLELRSKRRLRENHLNPAIKAGYIELTEPNAPTSPTQKYRLTEKGRQLLETL